MDLDHRPDSQHQWRLHHDLTPVVDFHIHAYDFPVVPRSFVELMDREMAKIYGSSLAPCDVGGLTLSRELLAAWDVGIFVAPRDPRRGKRPPRFWTT